MPYSAGLLWHPRPSLHVLQAYPLSRQQTNPGAKKLGTAFAHPAAPVKPPTRNLWIENQTPIKLQHAVCLWNSANVEAGKSL